METPAEYVNGRVKTMVGMAVSFTAMVRVFEKDSVRRIERWVEEFVADLCTVENQEQFDALHDAFCVRFKNTVVRSNAKDREDALASYGQGAKVLDVALKACVDYCQLPDAATARRIMPLLHVGIDGYILEYLKRRSVRNFSATSIRGINREMYRALQDVALHDIEEKFGGKITRVMYDNIMWRRLTRADQA